MAIFGFGKDKKEGGSAQEQILAYLEDAQRVRTPFILSGPRKAEVPATLQSIDESEGTLTFQTSGPLIADKGAAIDLLFILEGIRIGGSGILVSNRPGNAVLELPDSLELKERRSQPRARLNAKEGATCTALTGLFDGVGITGIVENVSESGVRIRVEKAMAIKGERKLPLGTGLVPPGQPFILIKLNKVPKCPAVLELEGKAAYLDHTAAGLAIGFRFSKPRADVASALRGLVSSRTSAIPSSLPTKTRRRPEPPSAPSTAFEAPAPPRTVAPPPEAPVPEPPPSRVEVLPPPQVEVLPAPPAVAPDPPGEEPQGPGNKYDSLLRLRKRSRAVVFLSRTAAFGDILKEFLQEDGFGRVLGTSFPDELLEFMRQPNLGVLFLDGNMSIMESLAFVQKLRAAFHDVPPIVLAAEDISTAIVLAARRNGVTQLVVRPYALDNALSSLLTEQIALS